MKYKDQRHWWAFVILLFSGIALGAADKIEWGNLVVKGSVSSGALTATTVPYANSSKVLTSSAVTPTELGYLSGVTSSLCGITQSCTQTNKTFTSPAINGANLNFGTASNTNRILLPNDTTTNLDALTDTAGLIAYDTTLSTLVVNNGTAWSQVSGSGSSGTNDQREYVSNGKFESATTGWSMYADAPAASAPVDCTGGSPASTGTRTTTAGEVIRETASFEMAKSAANRQGEGASYDFVLDYNDYNNLRGVPISFEYNTTSNFASGDILVYVYDKDAGGSPQPVSTIQSTTAGSVLASTGGTRWNGIFYPRTATSDDYRLCFHIATTNASAYDFHLDSVHVGNQNATPGAIVSPWASCTVTGSWSSNTTYSCLKRRIGEDTEYQIKLALAGAPTSASLTVNLPSGDVIDTNKLADSTASYSALPESNCSAIDAGVNGYTCAVAYNSTSAVSIMRALGIENGSAAPIVTGNAVTQAAPFTFGSGDSVQFSFKVPIVGQAASAAYSTNEMLWSAVAIGASGDPASATSGNPIIFPTKTFDNFSLYNSSTGQFTAPKTAKYRVYGALASASSATTLSVYVNGVSTALAGNLDSNGEATYNAAVSATQGQTIDLRPGGTVDATSSSFFVEEVSDKSIFSVFGISDYSSSTASTTNLPTTTQYGDLTSISLPPGEWDLGFNIIGHRNTASESAWTVFAAGISTTSGNSTSGLTLTQNWVRQTQTYGFGVDAPLTLAGYRVTPTTTTTYYLKYSGTYGSNQPQAEGTIWARRIK